MSTDAPASPQSPQSPQSQMLNEGQAQYKRILAVKLADMGDLLTVSPALQALRAVYPHAEITLLVPPRSASLLKDAAYIDHVVSFDKFAFDSLRGLLNPRALAQTAAFMVQLRRTKYDAIAIFHHYTTRWGTLKFAALGIAGRVPVRAGIDNGRGRFLTHKIPDKGFGAMHEAEYWLGVAALLGADAGAGWRSHVPVGENDRAVALGLLDSFGNRRANQPDHSSPLVAIHPGAGAYSPARIWPLDNFEAVARGLIHSHGARIVVVGGPDEVEVAAQLASNLDSGVEENHVLNLAGRTTVHGSAAVLELCDLFVGGDSGPMHLANAVGTPVVAVFGPSNKEAWGPYTPAGQKSRNTIVARDLPCMPCFYRNHSLGLREGCGTRPCLTGLYAAPVLAACRKTLDSILREAHL